MSSLKKTIFCGFMPELTSSDVALACCLLFLPWNWNKLISGTASNQVETWLKKYFKAQNAFTFDSGRYALYFALKALGVGVGDEVIVQAYTCIVVINAITWTGATPVYLDITDDFNADFSNLSKKITERTKAIIVQHTFGRGASIDILKERLGQRAIKIIEDCAHSMGASQNGKLLGTIGDIGMFSFGHDKTVPGARGGALITNDIELAAQIRKLQSELPKATIGKTLQHLACYPIFWIGKKMYSIKIGKWFLGMVKFFNITSKIIYQDEKIGKEISTYPTMLPNALALLTLKNLERLHEMNTKRSAIADIYQKSIVNPKIQLPTKSKAGDVCLRFTIRTDNPAKLMASAKKQNILLGNWYSTVIAPADIDYSSTGYQEGECPKAEEIARQSVNLPTNSEITKSDLTRVIDFLNKY